MKEHSVNNSYIWPSILVIGLPLLCGLIIVVATWRQADYDVQIWRQEFQFAIEAQCPQSDVDIVAGDGTVYLDANREQYEWVGERAQCSGNGTTINCGCGEE